MLKDKARTDAYLHAIQNNQKDFENKVVLDIGAGTGILSLFAAKCGAKIVYAVEGSNFAQITQQIVAQNQMESKIKVIQGRIEEIELPEKVDIIISEWMGFYLYHESMLSSLIVGRNKFLKMKRNGDENDGEIYPRRANIFASAVSLNDKYNDKVNYWKNVYGFDFSPLLPAAKGFYLF